MNKRIVILAALLLSTNAQAQSDRSHCLQARAALDKARTETVDTAYELAQCAQRLETGTNRVGALALDCGVLGRAASAAAQTMELAAARTAKACYQ